MSLPWVHMLQDCRVTAEMFLFWTASGQEIFFINHLTLSRGCRGNSVNCNLMKKYVYLSDPEHKCVTKMDPTGYTLCCTSVLQLMKSQDSVSEKMALHETISWTITDIFSLFLVILLAIILWYQIRLMQYSNFLRCWMLTYFSSIANYNYQS